MKYATQMKFYKIYKTIFYLIFKNFLVFILFISYLYNFFIFIVLFKSNILILLIKFMQKTIFFCNFIKDSNFEKCNND